MIFYFLLELHTFFHRILQEKQTFNNYGSKNNNTCAKPNTEPSEHDKRPNETEGISGLNRIAYLNEHIKRFCA